MKLFKRRKQFVGFLVLAWVAGSPWTRITRAGEEEEPPGTFAPVPSDPEVEIQMAKAAEFIKIKELARAIDIYQALIDKPEQSVVALQKDLFINHQEFCHRKIRSLGPEGLDLYRLKFDALVERLFNRAMKETDSRALKEIWLRYRCASKGEKAMELAGDLFYDRGALRQAISCWKRLIVWKEQTRSPVPPRLFGKTAILLNWVGEANKARDYIERGCRHVPGGAMRIAGEHVALADLPSTPHYRQGPVRSKTDGNTPGGPGKSVDAWAPGGLDLAWAWKHQNIKDQPSSARYSRLRSRGGNTTSWVPPVSFPVVSEGFAVFKDGSEIIGLDLRTGKLKWTHKPTPTRTETPRRGGMRVIQVPASMASLSRFGASALTADHGRVYAVVGKDGASDPVIQQIGRGRAIIRIRWGGQGPVGMPGNTLAAWDIKTGKILWRIPNEDSEEEEEDEEEEDPDKAKKFPKRVRFLWPPSALEDRLYVPALLGDEVFICCLDRETGALLWRTCVFARFMGGGPNIMNPWGWFIALAEASRIVLGEGVAVLLSNRGLIGAVDIDTGTLLWIAAYPSKTAEAIRKARGRRNPFSRVSSQSPSLPSHPILADGRVFFAPADAEHVYCLRADDGSVQWKAQFPFTGPRYLLGVQDGKVVVGGKSLAAFSVKSGTPVWGSIQFSTPPGGVGVLGPRYAYFPTGGFLYVLDLKGGKLVNRFGVLPKAEFGHFTQVGDRLVISYPKSVVCYGFKSFGGEEKKEGDKATEGGKEESGKKKEGEEKKGEEKETEGENF
ncbi:MAG: outer membrane protein assembly factor BamB family protein [Planctomycetota bacterium]